MEEDTRKRYGDMYADGCMDSTSSPVLWWCLGTALCALVTCPPPPASGPVVQWSPPSGGCVRDPEGPRGDTGTGPASRDPG